MKLHVLQGVHIFRSSGGAATLVAYRRIHTRYLVLVQRKSRYVFFASFDDLLNTVPIRSVRVHATLPLRDSLDATTRAWAVELAGALARAT